MSKNTLGLERSLDQLHSLFTSFSSKAPTSLMLSLFNKVMLEIADIGMTTKSSITIYVTTPFTNPPSLPAGGPTYCRACPIFWWQPGHVAAGQSVTLLIGGPGSNNLVSKDSLRFSRLSYKLASDPAIPCFPSRLTSLATGMESMWNSKSTQSLPASAKRTRFAWVSIRSFMLNLRPMFCLAIEVSKNNVQICSAGYGDVDVHPPAVVWMNYHQFLPPLFEQDLGLQWQVPMSP
ncbi:diacylglycerol O-acyltransferase 1, partial [Striga asiatica]